eukprot:903320-Pleurochrysis_carterae.AAC.1
MKFATSGPWSRSSCESDQLPCRSTVLKPTVPTKPTDVNRRRPLRRHSATTVTFSMAARSPAVGGLRHYGRACTAARLPRRGEVIEAVERHERADGDGGDGGDGGELGQLVGWQKVGRAPNRQQRVSCAQQQRVRDPVRLPMQGACKGEDLDAWLMKFGSRAHFARGEMSSVRLCERTEGFAKEGRVGDGYGESGKKTERSGEPEKGGTARSGSLETY